MNQIINWLRRIIIATAWEMNPPKPYGAFHLIFILLGFTACIFLSLKLRRISTRKHNALIFSIGLFLAICELYKQLFYYFYIGNGTYQWWIFPFQLCSVPMYLCLIAPCLRPGPIQKGMYNFMVFYNLLGGFMAFVEPSGLIHNYWTLTLHAFIWHMALVFIGVYLSVSGRCSFEKKDYHSATAVFLVLCLAAFSINLIFRKASDGSINMFFVGPSNSSLIVFKQISELLGWYTSTLLYIPVVCLGAFLVFQSIKYMTRKFSKIPA